jgi:CubicO group peptidase (beta-lactamase class C family)
MIEIKKTKFLFTILFFCNSCGLKFIKPDNPHYLPLPFIKNELNNESLVHDFLKKHTQFDAFIAIKNDSIITQWGCTNQSIMTHSARKSIMSVLIGIAIEKGFMKIDQTLAQLNIDDAKVKLTALEKTCTIKDLLTSRSGIYIEASGETAEMKAARPKRGQHKPGEFYYYNNWGFNVLGTIFEKQTKMSIGQAINDWLAVPLGMKDFRPNHVEYKNESDSEHKQYIIYMTAEDIARIGMMMLNDGNWQAKHIVNKSWIEESVQPYSEVNEKENAPLDHYGYLWWLDIDTGNYWATGWGGQFMCIDRKNRLVTVSRNDTGRTFIQKGLFMWKGKQGFRAHHQYLHDLVLSGMK